METAVRDGHDGRGAGPMRGLRITPGGGTADFSALVEKAVRDAARYARTVPPRRAHRVEMERASLEAFAPPRYYITRSGSPARPWWLERVSLGTAVAVGAFRTHAEAMAAAEQWVRDDYACTLPRLRGRA